MKKNWQGLVGLAALAGLGYYLWKQSTAKKAFSSGASGGSSGGTTSSVVPRSVAPLASAATKTASTTASTASSLLSTLLPTLGNLLGLKSSGGGGLSGGGSSMTAKGALEDLFGGSKSKSAATASTASSVAPQAQPQALQYDSQSGLFYDPNDATGTVYSDMWGNNPVGQMNDFALGSPYSLGSDYYDTAGTVDPYQAVISTPIDSVDTGSSDYSPDYSGDYSGDSGGDYSGG